MTTNAFSTIRLIAKNDHSGNPRRCYVTFQEGNPVAVYDEGYLSVNAITCERHRDAYAGYGVVVSVGEYRRWLKIGEHVAKGN